MNYTTMQSNGKGEKNLQIFSKNTLHHSRRSGILISSREKKDAREFLQMKER
jgi:hypothetical protein